MKDLLQAAKDIIENTNEVTDIDTRWSSPENLTIYGKSHWSTQSDTIFMYADNTVIFCDTNIDGEEVLHYTMTQALAGAKKYDWCRTQLKYSKRPNTAKLQQIGASATTLDGSRLEEFCAKHKSGNLWKLRDHDNQTVISFWSDEHQIDNAYLKQLASAFKLKSFLWCASDSKFFFRYSA